MLMSCSLCSIQWFPEIYYYHNNKNCYLYHDKICCFHIILLSRLSHSSSFGPGMCGISTMQSEGMMEDWFTILQ